MKRPTIALIGAGLSGLTLAHMLQNHANVRLYEKSRSVGGRMSTRRTEPFAFVTVHLILQHAVSPYIDGDIGLACIGDWCSGPSIEDVWVGSQKLAEQIINTL